jgi:hypothetical protein
MVARRRCFFRRTVCRSCADGPPLLLAVAFGPNPKHDAIANGLSVATPRRDRRPFTD